MPSSWRIAEKLLVWMLRNGGGSSFGGEAPTALSEPVFALAINSSTGDSPASPFEPSPVAFIPFRFDKTCQSIATTSSRIRDYIVAHLCVCYYASDARQ